MSRTPGDPPANPPRRGRVQEGDNTFQPAKPAPKSPKPGRVPDVAGPGTRPGAPTAGGASNPRRVGSTPARGSIRDPDEPRQATGGPTTLERVLFGSVSSGHLAIFCRQFSIYLDAGVDLLRALDSLRKQFERAALGPILGRIIVAVRRGDAVADACAREPKAFDTLFLSMVRVAEARGGLPETLKKMAAHYEARVRLIRQARSALIYPVMVVLAGILVIGLLTVFILPKLVDILKSMTRAGVEDLPSVTRALIHLSDFMQAMGWWLVPLIGVGGLLLGRWAYLTRTGKAAIDELALCVPVLGGLLRKIDTARMSRTLGDLLGAGVGYGESIGLTAGVLRLTPYRRALTGVRVLVMEGTELSVALDETRRFPVDVISIVESGEQTGKLPETLHKLADEYEEQVAILVKSLASLIQPLVMVVLGGMILFVALAFFMAYASILSGLSRGI